MTSVLQMALSALPTEEPHFPVQIPLPPCTAAQIAAQIFPPSSGGSRFVQRFLEQAEPAPTILLDDAVQTRAISATSINALAHLLDFSYDATHRYVTLLQLLGIMQIRRQGRLRLFVCAVGTYTPTATLQTYITHCQQQPSRRKYLPLLHQIEARCESLGLFWREGRVRLTEALTYMQTLAQPQPQERRRQLTTRLEQIALLSTTLLQAVQMAEPPKPPPANRAPQQTPMNALHKLPQTPEWKTQRPQTENTAEQKPTQSTQAAHIQSVSSAPAPSPMRIDEASTTDADASNVSHNVTTNVTSFYHYITTSALCRPQELAVWLAKQFEQDPTAARKYRKLFEQAPSIPRDPHVLGAAYLCTMIRLHRDGWNIAARPGGFFTKRCREYDSGIPEEVTTWISRYGSLSLDALLTRLQTEASERRSSSSSQAHHKPVQAKQDARVPVTPSWVQELPTPLPGMQLDTARLVLEREDDAYDLMEKMYRDRRTWSFRTRCVESQTHQRYAVLVEVSNPGAAPLRQTFVYSEADWQARLQHMERWQDFFEPTQAKEDTASGGGEAA